MAADPVDPTEMTRPRVSTRDPAEVRARLEAWFAARTGGPVTVGEIQTPEGTGMSSDTVLFPVTGPDGVATAHVARLAPDPDAMPLFPDYALDHQYRTMAEVAARSSVPVPPLVAHEPDPAWLGTEFLVMRRVDGVVPADIPPYTFGTGWLAEAAVADRARLQDHVVGVLAGLHSVPDARAAFPWLDPGRDALRAHVDGQRAFADWVLDGRTGRLVEAGFAWLEAHWPAGPFDTVLSWGDARIGNVLFADFTPVAVLDWEMAALGPPELDVSWTIFLHRFFDDLAVQFGLPGLPDFLRRGDVVRTYEARTGRTLRDLDWFTTYAAVRHAVIMTRVGLRSVHFGEAPMPASLDDLVTHRPALEAMLAGTYWDGVPS